MVLEGRETWWSWLSLLALSRESCRVSCMMYKRIDYLIRHSHGATTVARLPEAQALDESCYSFFVEQLDFDMARRLLAIITTMLTRCLTLWKGSANTADTSRTSGVQNLQYLFYYLVPVQEVRTRLTVYSTYCMCELPYIVGQYTYVPAWKVSPTRPWSKNIAP